MFFMSSLLVFIPIFFYLETHFELTWNQREIDAFTLYSASSYPSKMPCVMSCNIWQNDLNLKGCHWCQHQVNTNLQMCIDCLDVPDDTMPVERTFVYPSNLQNVEVALKYYWHIAKVSEWKDGLRNKDFRSSYKFFLETCIQRLTLLKMPLKRKCREIQDINC